MQTDLRSVSQQGPQWVRRQGLSPGKLQCVCLLSVESDVLAASVITFQLLATVQSHQVPRPHLSEDLPHRLHLPVGEMTCGGKWQREEEIPYFEDAFEGNHHQRSKRVSVHLTSRRCSPPWKIWGSRLSGHRWPAHFSFSAPLSVDTLERGRQPWGRRGSDARTPHSSSDAHIGWPSWSGVEEWLMWISHRWGKIFNVEKNSCVVQVGQLLKNLNDIFTTHGITDKSICNHSTA